MGDSDFVYDNAHFLLHSSWCFFLITSKSNLLLFLLHYSEACNDLAVPISASLRPGGGQHSFFRNVDAEANRWQHRVQPNDPRFERLKYFLNVKKKALFGENDRKRKMQIFGTFHKKKWKSGKNTTMMSKIEGTKSRRRQQIMGLQNIENWTGMTLEKMMIETKNREEKIGWCAKCKLQMKPRRMDGTICCSAGLKYTYQSLRSQQNEKGIMAKITSRLFLQETIPNFYECKIYNYFTNKVSQFLSQLYRAAFGPPKDIILTKLMEIQYVIILNLHTEILNYNISHYRFTTRILSWNTAVSKQWIWNKYRHKAQEMGKITTFW